MSSPDDRSDGMIGIPSNSELYRLLVAQRLEFLEFKKGYKEDMDSVKEILLEAKGGWKVFVMVGTAFFSLVAAVAWLAKELHIFK